jgi:hypothetical protein
LWVGFALEKGSDEKIQGVIVVAEEERNSLPF